jgi:NTP pyrophosphatase (non-canonical NTP hydrolase)
MSIQHDIVEAVRARGYLEGWTKEQLAARQVMKLIEEVKELVLCPELSDDDELWNNTSVINARDEIAEAGKDAREAFDDGECGVFPSTDEARRELSDIIVVCSVLAHALGVDDMMQGALDKAQADVKRGVR